MKWIIVLTIKGSKIKYHLTVEEGDKVVSESDFIYFADLIDVMFDLIAKIREEIKNGQTHSNRNS